MFEVIIYCGVGIVSFCLGFFVKKILTKNSTKLNVLDNKLYSIHYRIDDKAHSLLLDKTIGSNSTIYQSIVNIDEVNITEEVISYIRGHRSVVPTDEITLNNLQYDKAYIHDKDGTKYCITKNSSLFGFIDFHPTK